MKLVILLIFVIAYSESKSQNLEIHSTDTIKLDDFKVRQVVAYKISYVTFYFSLEECKNDFLVYWRRYEEKIKEMQRQKKKGKYKDTEVNRRVSGMDSVYNLLANKNNKDTIYISEQLFHWAGLRGFDIDKQIESGQCAVVDGNNKRHFLIIRQKVSYYKGPLSAWGGRTYLLPGHETYFCVGMDWIS